MRRRVSQLTVTLLLAVFFVGFGVLPAQATFTPSPARTVVTTLPDANAPDAPAVVTLQDENGDQTLYVREEDPENEGEYTYVPEDEVPLAEGDVDADADQADNGDAKSAVASQSTAANPMVMIIAVVGTICVLGAGLWFFVLGKRRSSKEEEK